MLDEAENQLDNGGMWMNPEAPVTESSENYGTERDVANCPFFLKTGACRFGDRCSRKHVYPTASPTLMIRGMFITFGMEESRRDDYEMDAWLEHSEEDLQETFIEFYHDALPEFKSVGKVVQFKVSCNYEPHLRGNVYVQFDTEEQCKEAFIKFNGRWYAGKQLHCEICPVTRWKNAICGLFDRQKCPKGKNCNFLHVFRNPGNEFWEADRDLHMSPDRSARGSHRDGWHSERYVERGWRQRHCSRSPPRSEQSHSRREDGRWRSRSRERSRERRSSHQQREDRWSFRSTHNDKGRERCRSRSRDRSRSSSRERELDRQRNRSKDKERKSKNRNKSEERDSKDRNTNTREDIRDSSRHTSRDGERNKKSRRRSKNRSPEKPEENPLSPNDETHKSRRHKHSKKKKKSKKKHKKKSHLPEGTISSGDSENEKESEEETVGKQSDTSQSQETNVTELQNNFDASGDREKMCEAKSEEFNTEVPNKLAGNDDITS